MKGIPLQNDGCRTAPELNGNKYYKSSFTRDVHLLAQVEKIWYQYDMDNNGSLEFVEILPFLEQVSSNVRYSKDDQLEIFKEMDSDKDG